MTLRKGEVVGFSFGRVKETDMAAPTLTLVKPYIAKQGDTLTLTGTNMADAPTLTKVWKREHGTDTWDAVTAANVTYKSATSVEVTITEGDAWGGGFVDIGVGESDDTEPCATLNQAVNVYTAGTDEPDNVMVGVADAAYIDGQYLGDFAEALDWSVQEEIKKIFGQHGNSPVKTYPGETTYEFTIPLLEATMENMQLVLGGGAIQDLGEGRRRMTFGGRTTIPVKSLMLVMPGPTGKKHAYCFYRTNVSFGGTISIGKDAARAIPMKVTVLEDTSRALGDRLGCMEEYPES